LNIQSHGFCSRKNTHRSSNVCYFLIKHTKTCFSYHPFSKTSNNCFNKTKTKSDLLHIQQENQRNLWPGLHKDSSKQFKCTDKYWKLVPDGSFPVKYWKDCTAGNSNIFKIWYCTKVCLKHKETIIHVETSSRKNIRIKILWFKRYKQTNFILFYSFIAKINSIALQDGIQHEQVFFLLEKHLSRDSSKNILSI